MGDVIEVGYSPNGDSPKWAEAKASARDVLENALRQYNPFADTASQRVDMGEALATTIERAIAEALFKAWQHD